MALLAIAIALGAWLRFAAIGAREMSADEGASWAAAAAPSLAEVVRIQAVLNPGKLAVYEIVLHGWMKLFGDGLGAMRALSAMLDTLSIVVVFVLVRELLGARSSTPQSESVAFGGIPSEEAETVAALAALLFAVNLVTIKYARELRMYPLALLIVLLQVWVFIRAARRGSRFDLVPLAVLTALAVATHFSAAFMIVAEALCLPALPRMPSHRARAPRMAPPLAIAAALGAGAIAVPDRGAAGPAHGRERICPRRDGLDRAAAMVGAARAVQQGRRQLRFSGDGRACGMGGVAGMGSRARGNDVRARMDVAAAAADAHRFVCVLADVR